NRATAADTAGEYAKAADLYRQALRLTQTLENGEFRRALAFNGLGLMQDAMGQFAEADKSFQGALAALDRGGEAETVNRATILSNVATLAMETRQFPRAEKLLRQAMAIYTKVPSPDPTRVTMLHNTLAELLILTGRALEAEPLVTDVITDLEKRPS